MKKSVYDDHNNNNIDKDNNNNRNKKIIIAAVKSNIAMSTYAQPSGEHTTPVQCPPNVRSKSTNIACSQGVAAIVPLILATTQTNSKIIKGN